MTVPLQHELEIQSRNSLIKAFVYGVLIAIGDGALVYFIYSERLAPGVPMWIFMLPAIPFLLMAWAEVKNSRYFQRATWVFRHVEPEVMDMRLSLTSKWDSYKSPPALIAVLKSPDITLFDEDSRRTVVFDPCLWKAGGGLCERVQVYCDPENDDLCVIRTSLGLLCSKPRSG